MVNMTGKTAAQSKKVVEAAIAEATRLCDSAIPKHVGVYNTPMYWERGERYQKDEFRNKKMAERIVCNIVRSPDGTLDEIDSREDLLALVEVYCGAGLAEVDRRFRVAIEALVTEVTA